MKPRGYTMVELIVVMGIVALLAALLFPVLAATRSKAGETVCMSNLRQLGAATLMYREDQGDYPGVENASFSGYVGHAKLRCPERPGRYAYNFGTYQNNFAILALKPSNDFISDYQQAVQECVDLRGPQFPAIVDMNHLPQIMTEDDKLYGIALAYRLSGSVDRVPKSRVTHIVLARGGLVSPSDLPCKPTAQNSNL